MKNIIILSLLLLKFLPAFCQAPPPPPPPPSFEENMGKNNEKIKMLKIAYITQELNLTEKEAQSFWPIYNRMTEEREVLLQAGKPKLNKDKMQDITDQEADKILNDQLIMEQKLLDLDKKYIQEFKSVLSASKILKLRKAERDFLHKVLRKIDEKRGKGERDHGKPIPPPHR